MTAKEKWDRLNNPTCIEDYGLSMTESEIRQVPEGRAFLLELKKAVRVPPKGIRQLRFMAGSFCRNIDKLCRKIITEQR